jgi:pyrimidine-nucleoside phosphorylase/thymidine phosphorylase
MAMIPAEIIARKRDGLPLSEAAIADFVGGFTRGEIADYQMAALAMAIFLRGMDVGETVALTQQMLSSGDVLSWATDTPKVDKHSTGGLGDKTSLVLAPLLACCDLQVPMISGRALGITGGTLDKLEAIPGFRTDLTLAEIQSQTERLGCVMCGATAELAPADRKLYALRDVTATVESIPLITASILSKKLAESLDSLVLDVKFGSGAFMRDIGRARQLAETLVGVSRQMGVKSAALLTDMNQPLGRMVGNAVEVHEAVAVLQGDGPADVRELVCALGAELLVAERLAADRVAADSRLQTLLDNGQAYERFAGMVAAQHGRLPAVAAAAAHDVLAPHAGYVVSIDGRLLGQAVIQLGGGRKLMTDRVDPAVGLEMQVRLGQRVERGEPVVRMFARPGSASAVEALVRQAITVEPAATAESAAPPLIVDIIAADAGGSGFADVEESL